MTIRTLLLATNFTGTPHELGGCLADALRWGAYFGPLGPSTALTGKHFTKAAAVAAIRETLAGLGPGDWGIVQISSHGTWTRDRNRDEPDGRDEAIVCDDLQLIVDDQMRALLVDRHPHSLVLLITDCCHSGTVFRMMGRRMPGVPNPRFLPPAALLKGADATAAKRVAGLPWRRRGDDSPLPGVIHFAGCTDTEYCYDATFNGKPNGAFSHYALNALLRAPPGYTFDHWQRDLSRFLPSRSYPQRPRLNATAKDKQRVIPGKEAT